MFYQVRAARNLLSAVTRLLILADMIDVHLLLKKLQRVEEDLEQLKGSFLQIPLYLVTKLVTFCASSTFNLEYLCFKGVNSQAELVESMKRFGLSAQDLMNQAAKRQFELKDPVRLNII